MENSTAVSFHCSECNAKFRFKHNLIKHIKKQHKKADYKCDTCNVLFTHKYNLTVHVRNKHSDATFTCNICHRNFSSSRCLSNHLQKCHHPATRDATNRIGLYHQSAHLYFPAEAGTSGIGGETSRIPVHGGGQCQEPNRLQVRFISLTNTFSQCKFVFIL